MTTATVTERSPGERLGDLLRETRAYVDGWEAQSAYLWGLVEAEPELVAHAAFEYVKYLVRSASASSRRSASADARGNATPPPAQPGLSVAERLHLIASGAPTWNGWDRYELVGGTPLSQATRVDLERSIAARMTDLKTRGRNLKLEQWIAARLVNEEQTVRDVWSERELDDLFRKAEAAADTYLDRFTTLSAKRAGA